MVILNGVGAYGIWYLVAETHLEYRGRLKRDASVRIKVQGCLEVRSLKREASFLIKVRGSLKREASLLIGAS